MVVAVNARMLLAKNREGIGHFSNEVVQRMARQHPEHQFHLLFDRPFDPAFITAPNMHGHVMPPQARHPLLWKLWFDLQVPRWLQKVGANVFFSPDGQCSLRTKVPQCTVVHDLAFLQQPADYQRSHLWYYRHYTPRFVRKSASVITVSEFSKADICQRYGTPETKIAVVPNGVREVFRPLPFAAQQAFKDRYTNGAEFFLYTGAIHPRKNLLNLLKAFSVFKRRLQSGLKLVLAGRLAWKNDAFLALLRSYKYRSDVLLTGYLSDADLAELTASAYAFVYPSLFEGFGVPVAEAMRCGVPVLTSKASAMEEVAAGAALYFNPNDVDDMADKLMRIYKDEGERNRMIEAGLVVAERYRWEDTAEAVWKTLVNVAAKR